MQINLFCGKGGVGKTTSAVAYALHLSQEKLVGIIDYDGGHSVKETLRIEKGIFPNALYLVEGNLSIGIINNFPFESISTCKERGGDFQKYINQFEGQHGIIAFADMVSEFFGIPTDIATTQKFILLVEMISKCRRINISEIIIDVEPTAGLQRLLTHSDSMMRSLRNLKSKGILLKTAISIAWPDIKKYLDSDYIKNIDLYTEDIEKTVNALKEARYTLVCTPEKSPVKQLVEVEEIIKNFGGKIHGYVINNIRGEYHEEDQIKFIEMTGCSVSKIKRQLELHNKSFEESRKVLMNIGNEISKSTLMTAGT